MTELCTLLNDVKINSIMTSNISKQNNSFSYFSRQSDFLIFQKSNGFCGHIRVPEIFYGFIIGKQGTTLNTIQRNTCTTIKVPRSTETCEIIVEGKSFETVKNALNEIVDLVNCARKNARLTHFISIPLTKNKEIMLSFQLFKDRVMENCAGDSGIQEEVFQKAHILHLTLSTLVLGDYEEVGDAIKLITRFKADNPCLFQRPFHVHIKGLGFFGNDASKVGVLYGKIDSSLDYERLQNLANQLQNYLCNEHVITRREYKSISLHMTLMNNTFLKSRTRKPFDCSNLINVCADWDFGVFEIDEVQLSVMGSSTNSSYYKIDGSFNF